ncbi:MAG: 3-isopropylmalate dehydratase small subunit [Candidatus Omnitrophica bacterium]|nr:3-isopropylmalate dehydratase small subunit [Candidatus Omnitrophota bacterium]
MVIKGKVHKFGDDINTDDIIAAKYLVTTDERELGRHCMENIAADFSKQVYPGDIIVAGKNFGCGSSREHAPLAIKGCGISAVIAKSFAGIFFRNAINIGLPFLELENTEDIHQADKLEIDLSNGIIKNLTQDKIYKTQPFPEFLQKIISVAGLINYVKLKEGADNENRKRKA